MTKSGLDKTREDGIKSVINFCVKEIPGEMRKMGDEGRLIGYVSATDSRGHEITVMVCFDNGGTPMRIAADGVNQMLASISLAEAGEA